MPDSCQSLFGVKCCSLLLAIVACANLADATDDPAANSHQKPAPIGYVFCSGQETNEGVPLYGSMCRKVSVGNLTCGKKVTVLLRHGDFLAISLPDAILRYVSSSSVSQEADKFVGFGEDSGVTDGGVPDCRAFTSQKNLGPRAISAPDPEYSEEARKKKISGSVGLSVLVGTDGRPRDIKVEEKLGYGLDEKAVEAVSRWKFQPALKYGQPVEVRIHVSVGFKLF